MFDLQARKILEPRVPRLRFRARRLAAARVIEYIRGTLQVGRLQTRLFKVCACVRLIQQSWKALKIVRTEQRALLWSQVITYEARLTAVNRRFATAPDPEDSSTGSSVSFTIHSLDDDSGDM